MTNKETITRNIGLTFDFVNYLIDNPSLIEKFSDRFKLDQKNYPGQEFLRNCIIIFYQITFHRREMALF